MKFFEWLSKLFGGKVEEHEEVVENTTIELEKDEVVKESVEINVPELKLEEITTPCHCHCNCHETEEVICDVQKDGTVEEDSDYIYLKEIDWCNITPEVIERLNEIDLNNYCKDIVNWVQISKYKGLPNEFILKYKDDIIWKFYNKCYLKKATKEILKEEGYI